MTASTTGFERTTETDMPTDNERREVARKLRAAKRPSLMVLMDVLGVGGEGVFARLADLIEPPTQCPYYRSDRHYCSIHDVPAIDRDALLALAEKLEQETGPVCGVCMGNTARRIREALGVTDDN